jgi:hypothetical protein
LIKIGYPFNHDNGAYEQTSQVAQDCFPQLKGTSILSSYGVEVVATVPEKLSHLLRIQRMMMM